MEKPRDRTLQEAVDRLTRAGYAVQYRAGRDGRLGPGSGDRAACEHDPEDFEIDEMARFEGLTNPDDQSVVFALRCPEHGTRGTYTAAYGPAVEPPDAEVVPRLGGRRRS